MRRTFDDPENEPNDPGCTRKGQTVFNTEAATQTFDPSLELLLHGNPSRNDFTSAGLHGRTARFLTTPLIENPSLVSGCPITAAGGTLTEFGLAHVDANAGFDGRLGLAATGMIPGLTATLGSTLARMPTKSGASIGILGTGLLDHHNVELGTTCTVMPPNYPGATINGILPTHDWKVGITATGVLAGHRMIGCADFGIKADYSDGSLNLRTLPNPFGRIQNSFGDFDPTLSVGGSAVSVTSDQALRGSMLAVADFSVKSPLSVLAGTSLLPETVFDALSSNHVNGILPIASSALDMFASSNDQYLLSSRTNVLTSARPLSLGPAVDYYSPTILNRPITTANAGIYRHAETQIKHQQFNMKLTLQFNDGKDVPAEWLEEAKLELTDLFDGVSYVEGGGLWKHEGVVFRNTWIWIMVEAPDLDSNQRLIKQFKEKWGPRLGQIELRVTSQEVKIL